MLLLGIAILSAITIGGVLVWYFIGPRFFHAQISGALNLQLFLITMPKEMPKPDVAKEAQLRPWQELVAVMEQFYSSLAGLRTKDTLRRLLYGNPYFCLEIALPHIGEEISFYAAVPRSVASLFEKQLHGFFPTAHIQGVEDYNIFNPRGVHIGARLRLAKSFLLPFKTYREDEADPVNELTSALSKLAEIGEGAAIQILFRPASSAKRIRNRAFKIARLMQEGKEFDTARREADNWLGAIAKDLGGATGTSKQKQDALEQERRHPVTPAQEELIKAIETKSSKVLFEVNVRLLASAPDRARAEEIAHHLEQSFTQYSAPHRNYFKILRAQEGTFGNARKLIFDYSFRLFSRPHTMILSAEELASIYHVPIFTIETPKVAFLKAKPAPVPANMPKEGLILGKNVFRGEETLVRLSEEDRRRHLYVIGQTGTGKTTFLLNLIQQDIEAGRGVGVIDPHGDLAEKVLGLVPPHRAEDVIYFDPSDVERPIGLNMLEWETPEERDFAVQEMIAIFMKLFPPEVIGPMFEHNMRNAMLTIAARKEEPGSLVEIPVAFTNEKFIKHKLQYVTDPLVKSFWEQEMAKTTEFHKSEMLGYLISKVGRFIENEMMRNIIGQGRSGFNFRKVMDEGKILIANLSKGKTGEVNASLLGLILVSKLQLAAMSRSDIAEAARRDFYLYIDEFQSFIASTETLTTILSEARKYRLSLILAHQFIGQLPEQLRDGVFGNVGTLSAFRVGPQDAAFLVKQFEPVFTEQDLVNIHNFSAYVKMLVFGQTVRPFNIEILPPPQSNPEVAQAAKMASRNRFGIPREEIAQDIYKRLHLGEGVAPEQQFIPGERNF